jgi:hypothetical protein
MMKKYEILLNELDRCEFVFDDQYTGTLADYSYNGITYEQASYTYCQVLEAMYNDFLSEWSTLSEIERMSAVGKIKLIISKRYSYGDFYFDVPSSDSIDAMTNDRGVPKQSVEIARFVHDMADQQKFYILRVVEFLGIQLAKEKLHLVLGKAEEEQNISDIVEEETTESLIDKTVYQTLHQLYGETMSSKQLADFFKVSVRTIFEWERKGYITNISTKSYETTSSGHKKRGEEKRYLTSDIAKSVEMQRMFSRL